MRLKKRCVALFLRKMVGDIAGGCSEECAHHSDVVTSVEEGHSAKEEVGFGDLIGVKDGDELVGGDEGASGVDLCQHVVHVVGLAVHLSLQSDSACMISSQHS